ncbi:MAG: cbb3-type cytochrome c oxidase subunit I [Opitutales bacterium]|nr:cbb3-type cytochrome c oxidase subunit I [Opitutales bacterium]
MSFPSTLTEAMSPTAEPKSDLWAKLSEVDRSMKVLGVFFVVCALLWLMAGTVFALVASIKMHNVDFLGDSEAWTWGRVRSAHLNAMIYGWAFNVSFAVAPWIMARLCRTRVRFTNIFLFGGIFWNIGVTIGIYGILAGHKVGVEWLEFPAYVTPVLALAFAFIGVWVILLFRWRQTGHVYVSQWYFLAAFFWLPWLYAMAQIMIVHEPARGVVQALTNWWFAHNVLGLWLTPIAVGAAYYLIPKVLGRPIYSYYLSVIGFWALALFYNWAGVHHLIGGPVPAWVISAGTVASVMMVIPVIVVAINHHMTVVGLHREGWASPTIRFVVFGAINYTAVSLLGSAMALRSVNEITHFTHFTVSHSHHGVYSFFTMIMFGGIYYMLPRLLNREWPSAMLISLHWWTTAVGVTLMVIVLAIGGFIQGMQLNAIDPETETAAFEFLDVMRGTIPYMVMRSMTGVLITIGHVAFFINIVWMLFRRPAEGSDSRPTLLTPGS